MKNNFSLKNKNFSVSLDESDGKTDRGTGRKTLPG